MCWVLKHVCIGVGRLFLRVTVFFLLISMRPETSLIPRIDIIDFNQNFTFLLFHGVYIMLNSHLYFLLTSILLSIVLQIVRVGGT